MKLALFDLDHTLIPFDSGMAWTRFLAGRGVLPADAPERYVAACQGYADGQLDIRALHRTTVKPLSEATPAQLAEWAQAYEVEMAPRLTETMQAVARRHRDAGDLCVLVTASPRFLAEPFARLFNIPYVLATESARDEQQRLTGEIVGDPCFREYKIQHVEAWLTARSLSLASSFEESWFYSDSFNDLPLLEAVTHPVAVRPDARLREHALREGWPVL